MKKNNSTFSVLTTLLIALSANVGQAQNIFAVTGSNQLINFNATSPQTTSNAITITGLADGQDIVGIDSRPNTGELYLLGYKSLDSTANLYTVNKTTAVATKIGSNPIKLALGDGTQVGFDFNPTVDRIRVVAGTGKNYRLHPVTGAIAFTDGDLNFAASDINTMKKTNAAASAYTNSYIGSGTTTLFNYDDSLNIITRQDPPNSGTLNTIGSTGINLGSGISSSGFDIYTDPSTLVQTAYLSITNAGSSDLYTINLTSGEATLVDMIGNMTDIKDIAAEIDRTIPARTGQLIYALQGTSNLISFDSENPRAIINLVTITGIASGQNIVGMDARPKTKELFVLGYNPANNQSQLYTVAPATGIATAINNTPMMLALGSGPVGMDFNPTVDRIRVVSSNNSNYRLHPITGVIAATDTALAYGITDVNMGQNPFVSSVAYTNSFDGATTTQLFGFDDSLNVLVLQSPPNRGTLTTIAPVKLIVNKNDPSTDFDIYYDTKTATNTAFIVANTGNETKDSLYTINLTTGDLINKGLIGLGIAVRDISVEIDPSDIVTSISDDPGYGNSPYRLKLYPNPLEDEVTIALNLKENAVIEIDIINIMGNIAISSGPIEKSAEVLEFKLGTKELPNGVYVVKTKINGINQNTIKVIK